MDISVIIVSYNVEHLLSICVSHVLAAINGMEAEVVVVDNASTDESVHLIQSQFPGVIMVSNDENVGFARGCHQGVDATTGRILLFLNPDAFVPDDYLQAVRSILLSDETIGTLTPLLIDGSGKRLPESARVRPTAKGALKYLLGVSSVDYHADIASEGTTEIDVISGACVAIRRAHWEQSGGFDKRYFMYAEDIDLSLVITQLGLKNIITTDHAVLHIKGESTRKRGWNYNRSFFKSMALFAEKYKGDLYSSTQVMLIKFVTIFLSIASFLVRFLKSLLTPIRDVFLFTVTMLVIQYAWAKVYYNDLAYYHLEETFPLFLTIAVVWVLNMALQGLYLDEFRADKKRQLLYGFTIGWLLSLIVYALLPEEWRSSRMILVLSGLIVLIALLLKGGMKKQNDLRHAVVLSTESDLDISFLKSHVHDPHHFVVLGEKDIVDNQISSVDTLVLEVDSLQGQLAHLLIRYQEVASKLLWSPSQEILIYSDDAERHSIKRNRYSLFNLSKSSFQLQKRAFDVIMTVLLLPILILFHLGHLRNLISQVLLIIGGKKTIIGYRCSVSSSEVPRSMPALLHIDQIQADMFMADQIKSYAMHYSIFDDIYYTSTYISQVIKAYGSQ